ncbi:pleckstrin homology domain-containing family A member 8 [Labeo rohita]|uniref:Pleckstrin homology domain-containing family A member 8 n=3 Tax=Labeonini TaxID=2743697 RepID=A0A498NN14_LABRO|nr:pleckstrin homology domain-containing family A member 8 [Labeo rohita]KAI2655466.1 Pleckstrin homology domain-containing family A member 8 [Labeo rohita]RXN33410.1 pleckstrin homology domain-containing family A member 8 [Labeo rohita]
MEGVLYKWTNYISGWQPRWFVLEGGTLSYYDSQEDAWKGCKGSIKISVCEIQVHPSDFTRVDLIIPGEQYFYLRAINAAERQKWLVALGTAKACLTDNRTKREKELQENTEALKTKMSELRLYCDLLLQQVNKIQESSVAETTADLGEAGDETGNLVKSTCTTFLKTLEECMQIASRTFNPDLLSRTPPGSPPVATIKPQKIKPVDPRNQHPGEKQKDLTNISGTSAHDSGPENEPPPSPQEDMPTSNTGSGLMEDQKEPMEPPIGSSSSTEDPEESVGEEKDKPTEEADLAQKKQEEVSPSPTQNKEEVTEEIQADLEVNEPQSENKQEEEDKVDTFFSTMSHRFSDIILEDDSGIPTQAFLDSCYAIVPVLDKLGPTVFAPVKIDFVGNIKKIQQKVVSDPESFPTLQSIVLHEVETEVAQVRNSATEALLWLKRGLKFLKEFLSEINKGMKDVQGALNNAYGKTLRQYHGWVVRGVFALALRAAPSYEGFMAALVSHEGDELKEGFMTGMHRDLDVYLPAMENQLSILDALYEEYGLESDEVV